MLKLVIYEGSSTPCHEQRCAKVRTSSSTSTLITNAVNSVCSSAMWLQPLNIPLRPLLLPRPAEPLAAFFLPMELKTFALIVSLFFTSCSQKSFLACFTVALHLALHPTLFWLLCLATPSLWKIGFLLQIALSALLLGQPFSGALNDPCAQKYLILLTVSFSIIWRRFSCIRRLLFCSLC